MTHASRPLFAIASWLPAWRPEQCPITPHCTVSNLGVLFVSFEVILMSNHTDVTFSTPLRQPGSRARKAPEDEEWESQVRLERVHAKAQIGPTVMGDYTYQTDISIRNACVSNILAPRSRDACIIVYQRCINYVLPLLWMIHVSSLYHRSVLAQTMIHVSMLYQRCIIVVQVIHASLLYHPCITVVLCG